MNIFKFGNLIPRVLIANASRFLVSVMTFVLTFIVCHVQAAAPSQTPLFLSVGAKPHIALVMSVDHELFKKAYTDYANLDGAELQMKDTTYRDDFDYYGYFDSDWCYSYKADSSAINNHFVPISRATAPAPTSPPAAPATTKAHQCVGSDDAYWSGNFLNWVSMTRMDIVRRVLFGGARSVDTSSSTILERAYLPKDVHAFAKVYGSSTDNISLFTPYVAGTTYSFCNVSTSANATTGYPLIRAAAGDWPLWATLESAGNSLNGKANGNCSLAEVENTLAPTAIITDFTAKVEACTAGKNATVISGTVESTAPRCRQYGAIYKPSGLLQKYGESGVINFSLMSGSYKANHMGGVLRKAAGPLVSSPANSAVDEIDTATGQFNDVPGIIRNISKFRISTYSFSSKNYSDCNTYSIPISDFKTSTNAGRRCRDWGNPLSEIYLETLRYIAGKSATSIFAVDDSTAEGNYPGIAGLSKATWNDPWPVDQYCAKCSVIVLSTGSNSFDSDNLAGVSDLPGLTVDGLAAKTDLVGAQEYGSFVGGKKFFMGGLDAKSRYCQSFSITGLSSYTGICPELPALEGGYHIAGLAHYARTTDLRPTLSDGPGGIYKQKVNTYAVDLAESVPTIPVTVGGNTVQILPACESNITGSATDATATNPWSTCSLFDVKVRSLTYSGGNLVKGSMSFYWEDSLWGSDYDLDVEQRLDFCVGPSAEGCNSTSVAADEIKITNKIPYAEAGNALRLTYSIYGVTKFRGSWRRNHAADTSTEIPSEDFDGGLATPWMLRPGGRNYAASADLSLIPNDVGSSEFIFRAASSSVVLPKKPLFLAAKYGGFTDLKRKADGTALVDDALDDVTEWDNYKGSPDKIPDNYFSVKNPSLLEESLDNIFTNILRRTSSASAVATSSTRLQEGQFVYQAIFDSSNWSGELKSYEITPAGVLPSVPTLTTRSAGTMPETGVGRNVYTYKSDGAFSANNADGSARATVQLEWARLHSSQQTKLALTGDVAGTAQKRANWLLGNKTDENALTGLRVRDFEDASGSPYRNILGDIVNSSPAFVGAYNYRYYSLPTAMGGDTYLAYLAKKRGAATRDSVPRVFVGSNDGMLHAFNANTMQELFAYVPNAVFHKLAKLAERDYGTSANPHQFLVDGPIVSGDAFISTPSDSTRKWRSIVVGTFGAGAKGIYALDVTNQNRPEVLFEYAHANMGYILGKPFIAPTAEGRWAVITGNGIDSGGTPVTSKLFVVDLEQPFSKTKIIDVAAGTGLSAPALLTDAIGVAKTVYAGDLSGNVWRFSIDNIAPASWTFYKVFTANRGTSGSPVLQPIVAAPTIGYNAKLTKNMVYFGTGKYHDDIDKSVGGIRHSFYAVPDMGATGTAVTRSTLLQKTMTTSYASGSQSRTVTEVNPDWTSKKGWYIDLDYSTADKRDERITTKAILVQDKLIITTLIPSDASCLPGGSSWLMQVTAVGDRYVTPGTHVLTPPPGGGTPSPAPAFYSEELFLGDLNMALMGEEPGSASGSCGSDLKLALINSGTSASSPKAVDALMKACMVGRQSWRQLK